MPIEVQCPNCGKKLRAPAEHLGKQAKCPQCQAAVTIRGTEVAGSSINVPVRASGVYSTSQLGRTTQSGANKIVSTKPEWHLMTGEQQQFGPVMKAELDSWLTEGRVDSSCQILKDGWDQWKWADEIYPQLAGTDHAGALPKSAPPTAPLTTIGTRAPATSAIGVGPGFGPGQSAIRNPAGSMIGASGQAALGAPHPSQKVEKPVADQPSGDGAVSTAARTAIADARPWVMLLAVAGFTGCALGALSGLQTLSQGLQGDSFFLIAGVVFVIFSALYGVASYFLFQYASRLALVEKSGSSQSLEEALSAEKFFWRFIAVLTPVFLGVYLIIYVYYLFVVVK